MNLSGESLRAACDFFKVDPEEGLIVIYDDISLAPGQLRVRKKGSAGRAQRNQKYHCTAGHPGFSCGSRLAWGRSRAGWDLAGNYGAGAFLFGGAACAMEEAFDRAGLIASVCAGEQRMRSA